MLQLGVTLLGPRKHGFRISAHVLRVKVRNRAGPAVHPVERNELRIAVAHENLAEDFYAVILARELVSVLDV